MGLATGKQSRSVRAGQHPHFAADRPHGRQIPTVHSTVFFHDGPTDLLLLELSQRLPDLGFGSGSFWILKLLQKFRRQLLLTAAVFLLHAGADELGNLVLGKFLDLLDQALIRFRDLRPLFRPVTSIDELFLQGNSLQTMLLAETKGFYQIFLGNLLGSGFDHEDSLFCGSDHQIQVSLVNLLKRRVEDKLPFHPSDPTDPYTQIHRGRSEPQGGRGPHDR